MQNTVIHEIPAVWDGESRILMLWTMPSPASREAGFFYMHPRNRFWQVLPAVFGALAGMCTGLIHTKLKVNPILSEVLVQTALISVNVLISLSFGEITSKSTSFAVNPLKSVFKKAADWRIDWGSCFGPFNRRSSRSLGQSLELRFG